jgi:hypothetical protein
MPVTMKSVVFCVLRFVILCSFERSQTFWRNMKPLPSYMSLSSNLCCLLYTAFLISEQLKLQYSVVVSMKSYNCYLTDRMLVSEIVKHHKKDHTIKYICLFCICFLKTLLVNEDVLIEISVSDFYGVQ